ncbi:MAG TPA: NAD(P)H-dependent oxidoreductase [Flavobacterium sp.]|jgi:FMN-dependent NADH-azoreductase
MKRILHLKSSLLGSDSHSIRLGNAIVDQIVQKYPDSTCEELDLIESEIPHLTPVALHSMFSPAENLPEEQSAISSLSDILVAQLLQADIIVMGAPLINFTIPSQLKAWIDHVTRPGKTFSYGADGRPAGLVVNKKIYIAMASGGVYSEGPGKANDFVVPYLQAFLGFLGMTDISVFRAEGLKVPGIKEHAMEKAIGSIVID